MFSPRKTSSGCLYPVNFVGSSLVPGTVLKQSDVSPFFSISLRVRRFQIYGFSSYAAVRRHETSVDKESRPHVCDARVLYSRCLNAEAYL
jgi:hypothetical protein